ncbi:hypothetical protein ACPV51_26145, partial [Vibrio astriarenae]
EPSQHIEPIISNFDVVDEEDEYVVPQVVQQLQPAQVEPQPQYQHAESIQAAPSSQVTATFEPAPVASDTEIEAAEEGDQDAVAFQNLVASA